jgi:hypothetical protein
MAGRRLEETEIQRYKRIPRRVKIGLEYRSVYAGLVKGHRILHACELEVPTVLQGKRHRPPQRQCFAILGRRRARPEGEHPCEKHSKSAASPLHHAAIRPCHGDAFSSFSKRPVASFRPGSSCKDARYCSAASARLPSDS